MKLIVLSSSSRGNCYILRHEDSEILLDAGVDGDKIIRNINPSNLKGILASHIHGDHIRGISKLSKYLPTSVKVHSHKSCLDVIDIPHTKKNELIELKPFKLDCWTIIPFFVGHDVPCYNYIIKNEITKSILVYVSDTGYLDNINLPEGVDYFLIEANHDEEVLRELIELNDENKIRYERVISRLGHLSVQKTKTFLERTSDVNTKKIVLCHLSRSNYQPNKFRNIIAAKFPSVDVFELDPTEVSNVREIVLRKKKINFSEL